MESRDEARARILSRLQTELESIYRVESGLSVSDFLIDGEALAQLMIDFGLGVTTFASYELKRIDSDYFADEE